MTLLWSLFAITKVEDTDVAEEHHFTQWIGRGMFMMYHITSIIVLLNMLIAMMSHSFQTINVSIIIITFIPLLGPCRSRMEIPPNKALDGSL